MEFFKSLITNPKKYGALAIFGILLNLVWLVFIIMLFNTLSSSFEKIVVGLLIFLLIKKEEFGQEFINYHLCKIRQLLGDDSVEVSESIKLFSSMDENPFNGCILSFSKVVNGIVLLIIYFYICTSILFSII